MFSKHQFYASMSEELKFCIHKSVFKLCLRHRLFRLNIIHKFVTLFIYGRTQRFYKRQRLHSSYHTRLKHFHAI